MLAEIPRQLLGRAGQGNPARKEVGPAERWGRRNCPDLGFQPRFGRRATPKSGVAPGARAPQWPHQFQETRAGGAKC